MIQANSPTTCGDLRLLDCSCGIGTQAIGLAILGYDVHGTDVSPGAIERARKEAARLDATVTFDVVNFKDLSQVDGTFEIVLSCDNALAHATGEGRLRQVVTAMSSKLAEGGLLLVSIDDYDAMLQARPTVSPVRKTRGPEGTCYVFRARDWSEDGHTYTLDHFIVRETAEGWNTTQARTHCRAIKREDLAGIVSEAGLGPVTWHLPKETGYFQQILTARKEQTGEPERDGSNSRTAA